MNCKQANQIPLTKILEREGFTPVKRHSGGHELWFTSPLRKERTPSFSVNEITNEWFDFGEGKGGSVIDFVCHYASTNVAGALGWLEERQGAYTLPAREQNAPASCKTENKPRYEMVSIQQISNKGLLYYLHTRGIPASLAREYLTEGHYRDTASGKMFYGLALKNEQGGYAIRNKYMKTAISPQAFTIIKSYDPAALRYHVFEGVMDFLTWLALTEKTRPADHVIILNSLTQAAAAAQFIASQQIAKLEMYLWLDNEPAGSQAAGNVKRAQQYFTALGYPCYAANANYMGYKDLNKRWTQTNQQRFELTFTLIKAEVVPPPENRAGQRSQLRLDL